MRHCGGLLRVLIAVGLDTSLAVDSPHRMVIIGDSITQPSQGGGHAGAEAATCEAGAASKAAAAACASAGSRSMAASAAVETGRAAAGTTDALHFPLQQYDRVKLTLQSNCKLGMALLEGYDQIPQPTLDVYRCCMGLGPSLSH